MEAYNDILDKDFLKNLKETQVIESDYLWVGKPLQKFKLWNSLSTQDILRDTFIVLGAATAVGFLISLISLFFVIVSKLKDGFLFTYMFPVFLASFIGTLVFLLSFDLLDWFKRKSITYFIGEQGISIQLKAKKAYLIPWEDIQKIKLDETKNRILIESPKSTSNKINTNLPQSSEIEPYAFLELHDEASFEKAHSVILQFKEVE